MTIKTFSNSGMTCAHNERAIANATYTDSMRSVLSHESAGRAQAQIKQWPGYEESPLCCLDGLAERVNVARVFYKDESERFGLKSFKALGGSYAVAQQLISIIEQQIGRRVEMQELFTGEHKSVVGQVTVAAATDGNHGRSVAWGARLFGCRCIIYIHADVSPVREKMMAELGADVRRISGNYDDSMRIAAAAATEHGWTIISDNSYEGYLEIPKFVTAGYTVMLAEAARQLDGEIPTHIFIQGGCGGLASSVCGYYWELWGERRPRLIVVEPEQANCLQLSACEDDLVVVDGKLETLMAGLACGEVSPIAWEILETGANDFITLPEKYVPLAMRSLAQGIGNDVEIEAGESAVAGVGALIAIADDESARSSLGLTNESTVLVFGTEGATDPDLYAKLIADPI